MLSASLSLQIAAKYCKLASYWLRAEMTFKSVIMVVNIAETRKEQYIVMVYITQTPTIK